LARTTSPRTRGEVNKRSHSHTAIFVSRSELKKPASRFSPIGTLFASLRHCQQREEQKRRQNADRRVTNCCTCRRSARFAGALACRRSTAALARETAGPQGSASGHASGDSPGRSILYGRPNRGAETLRFSAGVTRAGKTTNDYPRTVSTSHAGHSAGRLMPDAARERVVSPPAGTALAPLSVLPSAEGVLHRARFDGHVLPKTATIVKSCRNSKDQALIFREFSACPRWLRRHVLSAVR